MKKSLSILFVFLYMLGMSGMAASFHYCGDTFKYVELISHKEDGGCRKTCCGKKKAGKKDKCCKDKTVKVEKQDHQLPLLKFTAQAPLEAALPVVLNFEFSGILLQSFGGFIVYHLRPPPLCSGLIPLYLFYSVFRI